MLLSRCFLINDPDRRQTSRSGRQTLECVTFIGDDDEDDGEDGEFAAKLADRWENELVRRRT